MYDPEENEDENGRVLVSYVSHIGGHKFAGNVLIYLHHEDGRTESVWLGRVFPHHVKFIIEETILKGILPKYSTTVSNLSKETSPIH